MTPRLHSPPSASGVTLSGTLDAALVRHATQRARSFFLFLFAVDAACSRVRAIGADSIAPADAVQATATHQIDAGFRSTDPAHGDFDVKNPAVVRQTSTAFKRTDAAHYCNLGLRHPAWKRLQQAGLRDAVARDLILLAERLAGDTAQLPQRVNIGPDRVIDVHHGSLADTLLKAGGPVFTTATLRTYLAQAAAAMTAYRAGHRLRGNLGICACCDAYLRVYGSTGQDIWQNVANLIYAECGALGIDDADYVRL